MMLSRNWNLFWMSTEKQFHQKSIVTYRPIIELFGDGPMFERVARNPYPKCLIYWKNICLRATSMLTIN